MTNDSLKHHTQDASTAFKHIDDLHTSISQCYALALIACEADFDNFDNHIIRNACSILAGLLSKSSDCVNMLAEHIKVSNC